MALDVLRMCIIICVAQDGCIRNPRIVAALPTTSTYIRIPRPTSDPNEESTSCTKPGQEVPPQLVLKLCILKSCHLLNSQIPYTRIISPNFNSFVLIPKIEKTMQILTVFLGLILSTSLSEAELGVISDISDETFEMLISGGYKPKSNRLSRHVVSIRTRNYVRHRGDNHFCSGVLVSSRAVLTAAHCLTDRYKASMNPRGIRVVFGHIARLAAYEEPDFRSVDRLVVHPEYERYKKNDLAILRLSERIQSSNHDVLPLLMRKTANVTYGDTCITLGWGQIYQHGPYSDELVYLDVILRPPSLCEKHYDTFTADHNVCTEPVDSGMNCAGDMGGPLLCKGALFGLIGGHMGCAGGKAMKFLSFLYYKDWILVTIQSLSDSGAGVPLGSVFLIPFVLILVN